MGLFGGSIGSFLDKIPGVNVANNMVGGLFDALSGKPTPTIQAQAERMPDLTPEQLAAFNITPEEQQYIDFIANQVYNPATAPSAAQALINQNMNTAAMQAGGQIANTRGNVNPVVAARQAQQAMTEAQQGAVNQGAAIRAQEQQANQQAYADLSQRERQSAIQRVGAETGISQFNAQAQNAVNLANASAINQSAQNARTAQANMIGNLGAGAAKIFSSDIRLKKNIGDGENAIYEFLDNLDPYTYEYKDNAPKGTDNFQHLGIMAQDVERSPAGKKIVTQDNKGNKMIKPDLGTLLAAQAFNHKRLKELEARAGMSDVDPSRVADKIEFKGLGSPSRPRFDGLPPVKKFIGGQVPTPKRVDDVSRARGEQTLRMPPVDLYGTYKDRTPPQEMIVEDNRPTVTLGEPEMTYYPPEDRLTGYPYGKIGSMPRQGERMMPSDQDYQNIKDYLDVILRSTFY